MRRNSCGRGRGGKGARRTGQGLGRGREEGATGAPRHLVYNNDIILIETYDRSTPKLMSLSRYTAKARILCVYMNYQTIISNATPSVANAKK